MLNTRRTLRSLAALGAGLLLAGCLSTAQIRPEPKSETVPTILAARGIERDRQAILAMLGDYHTTFAFQEQRPAPGYTPTPRYSSEAYEMVVLAEDHGTKIILQHLLVHRNFGFVIKHWRQDWEYQAATRLEFTEDQTWRLRRIPASVTRGAWTQCVYEVSDAPRYCGTGKWTYAGGVPSWTSDAGWRPLPRREYTKRSDYNALGIVNIHRITPAGWEHAQINRKVVRDGPRVVSTLVHEAGLNKYSRISGYNFSSGYRYWENTKGYWAQIRAEWDRRIVAHQGLKLTYPVDGMGMIWPMYRQSEVARAGIAISDTQIRDLFAPWVVAP